VFDCSRRLLYSWTYSDRLVLIFSSSAVGRGDMSKCIATRGGRNGLVYLGRRSESVSFNEEWFFLQ